MSKVGADEALSELKEFLLSCGWKPGQGGYQQDISHPFFRFIIMLFCFICSYNKLIHPVEWNSLMSCLLLPDQLKLPPTCLVLLL